jgi:hypothetical protein
VNLWYTRQPLSQALTIASFSIILAGVSIILMANLRILQYVAKHKFSDSITASEREQFRRIFAIVINLIITYTPYELVIVIQLVTGAETNPWLESLAVIFYVLGHMTLPIAIILSEKTWVKRIKEIRMRSSGTEIIMPMSNVRSQK